MNQQLYQHRVERLQKAISLDTPPVIVALFAIHVAQTTVEPPTRIGLIRWLIDNEKEQIRYQLALQDPDSDESKEMAEIEKDLDDLEIDETIEKLSVL